ncbi:GGDEF domain-containing protein [Phormidium sp. FACHB-592]|uniref:GGDEF domain-containing protein n=1 Tax=Stenomitos frigidus AS-A4 TaxID=2933935 RepID=A0ABV0KRM0_9CYAN|nr:GGDEF domain-containing protein [Phormidium sp. FACHB-592]MBD2078289.1 GGDEF domain-containing protein [Phormidium sp. FACHB-592]
MNDSNRDNLTGLGNQSLIQTRFKQYAGDQTQFGIILVDIDGFIYFNDCYGHNEGDEKLKQIAHLIRQTVPSEIDVFRSGGDEFVVFLNNLRRAEVLSLAMQICKAVNEQFSHLPPLKRYFSMGDLSHLEVLFPLTVSCGVAFYPEHGVDYPTLYREAGDAAIRGGKRLYGGIVGVAMNFYDSCFLPSTNSRTTS